MHQHQQPGTRSTHVHYQDPCFVKLFHNFCRRDTDGADKQFRFLLDDDVDEIVKLAFGVVVVCLPSSWAQRWDEQIDSKS
jgi:hypothetical protein